MATQPPAIVSPIRSQPLNDWYAYLDSEKVGKAWAPFVLVTDYGTAGVPGGDDSPAIQAAVDSLQDGGTVIFPRGHYYMSTTVKVPLNINLHGIGKQTILSPNSTNSFQDGYMFFFNTQDGITPVQDLGIKNAGEISGFYFDNSATNAVNARGFKFFGGYEFKNLAFHTFSQMAYKLNGYSDFMKFDTIHFIGPQQGDSVYAMDLDRGSGDAMVIDRIDFGSHQPLGIAVQACRGGVMSNVLNGRHKITQCHEFEINAMHNEGGSVTIDSSDVAIKTSRLTHNAEFFGEPIVLTSPNTTDNFRNHVTLDNVRFQMEPELHDFDNTYDLKIHPFYHVTIRDCYRRFKDQGRAENTNASGILIKKNDGSDLVDFNNYSYIASQSSEILPNEKARFQYAVNNHPGPIAGFDSDRIDSSDFAWTEASGTYYYTVQFLLDPIRKIGSDGSRIGSVALTNGGPAPQFYLYANDPDNYTMSMNARVYRGTASGSYDHYVDLPIVALRRFFDTGQFLSGYPWIARTARPSDTLNADYDYVYRNDDNIVDIIVEGGAPERGTWKRGDKISNLSKKWLRLTDGDSHVIGTDWKEVVI